jgi:intein-encoded DNA endonuclease-like protein
MALGGGLNMTTNNKIKEMNEAGWDVRVYFRDIGKVDMRCFTKHYERLIKPNKQFDSFEEAIDWAYQKHLEVKDG